MPLYGITHDLNGKSFSRLARTLKVGIGYPKGQALHVYIDKQGKWCIESGVGKERKVARYDSKVSAMGSYADLKKSAPERKYPGKLGYFTFQRVGPDGGFTPDWDAIEIHGPMPTEVGIVFLDNDPLRQQMEWWTAAECKCSGDGRSAIRRLSEAKGKLEQSLASEAKARGEQFFPIVNGCFAYGCPLAKGEKPVCKPHTRLQFQLQNAPAFGSTCTYDSTGFRSAIQLHSSMQQILTVTGRGNPAEGVIAGIPLLLKVLPYKTSHGGQPSTQFGVTLHMRAADAIELVRTAITKGQEFKALAASARLQIAPAAMQIEAGSEQPEIEGEVLTEAAEAAAMEAEFYPQEDGSDELPMEAEDFEAVGETAPPEVAEFTVEAVDEAPAKDGGPEWPCDAKAGPTAKEVEGFLYDDQPLPETGGKKGKGR